MMTILSLGLVRGLIGQVIGTAVGIGLVALIQNILGRPFSLEPALVAGAVLGTITFMIAARTMDDWFKWMRGEETPFRHGPPEGKPAWTRYLSVDYNHKTIGVQYTVTSIVVVLVAGLFALIFRTELMASGLQYLTTDKFNTLVGMHGIVMIAGILIGVGGMANYLVPLMIGASDMAFPRLNAFAYWINVPGAVLVLSSMVVGGWDTGWTGYYPPLSVLAPIGLDLFMLGVYMVGLSSILGSLNLIITTFTMRAPGMSLFRMPIFVWAMLATSIIGMTATQLIGLSFLMVVAERVLGLGFLTPSCPSKLLRSVHHLAM
jgi:cytochrome c oxidase subunit 1